MFITRDGRPPGASGARRLPRGPHDLPREEVERSQRERLLLAAADAVGEKGYAATSVEDILKRAGVSRATFYQLYDDKLDCFLAAYRMASEVVAAVMLDDLAGLEPTEGSGHDGRERPDAIAQLDRLLGAYLQTLAENPTLARVFLVEVYAAGPSAIRQRRESLDQFVDLIAAVFAEAPGILGDDEQQRFAAEVLAGAVSSLVTNLVGVGEAERLPELHRPLMELAARITS